MPRAATIHEYLDWTVTASEAEDPDELVGGAAGVLGAAGSWQAHEEERRRALAGAAEGATGRRMQQQPWR